MMLSRLPALDPYGLPMAEEGEMEREQVKNNDYEVQKQISQITTYLLDMHSFVALWSTIMWCFKFL